MKKIFKTLALLVCTVCALVLSSCGGGSKPITYEEFHQKALEVKAKAPEITRGHIVINISTKYEHINYESDFTIQGDALNLVEEPFYYSWREKIIPAIKSRAYLVEDEGENREYYYNAKEGFTVNSVFNDEISYQYVFDVNGYLTKSWDPSLEDNYITTIEWYAE